MSPCELIGKNTIICGPRRLNKICRYCKRKLATLLCDWPLPGGGTCDAPVCVDCSTPIGPGKDYCKVHNADPR